MNPILKFVLKVVNAFKNCRCKSSCCCGSNCQSDCTNLKKDDE